MIDYLEWYTYFVSGNCFVAFFTNSTLIYLIINHTKHEIGKYRYLLMFFACFNISYAIVLLIGIPVNFLGDRSWIVFTHGLLGRTSLSFWGSGLYCTFYEIWICLVLVHFVYRYIVVCRQSWVNVIQNTKWAKLLIVGSLSMMFAYTVACGLYFCSREEMSDELAHILTTEFHLASPKNMGYILLRTQKLDGSFSLFGTITIIDHFILSYVTFSILLFCGVHTWKEIQKWQELNMSHRKVKIQKQLFVSLVIQTSVPFLLCHLPTMIYLSFPFWGANFSFGPFSIVFAYLTSVNKVIDPCITIMCIGDYRKVIKHRFRADILNRSNVTSTKTTTDDPHIQYVSSST